MKDYKTMSSSIYTFINKIFKSFISSYSRLNDSDPSNQHDVFKRLIKLLSQTSYGEKFSISPNTNYKEFREKLPINTYDDLKPYIHKMMLGEKNVLVPWASHKFC